MFRFNTDFWCLFLYFFPPAPSLMFTLWPLFSLSLLPVAQHNVSHSGNNKAQLLSPLKYLSHLHVPGLSDISDVERNLSELSVTSSVDSGFKGSGHSFRLHVPGSPGLPVRCKCMEWPCVCHEHCLWFCSDLFITLTSNWTVTLRTCLHSFTTYFSCISFSLLTDTRCLKSPDAVYYL